ncbi:type 1 secretion target domain protein, partial [Pseudomonas sp. GW456-E7]
DAGMLLGSVVADVSGNWSFIVPELGSGVHKLTATVTTDANGESAHTAIFELTVDTVAPAKPGIDAATDDVGAQQGPVSNGGSTDDTTPTLSGKGESGSTVHISDNGRLLGSVLVDGNGNWSFTPGTPLIDGEHSFTVVSEDLAGNTSEPLVPYVVIVSTVEPAAPSIESVFDDQGNKQSNLLAGDTTDD